jgi:hypothetical protein
VLEGRIEIDANPASSGRVQRPSVRKLTAMVPRRILAAISSMLSPPRAEEFSAGYSVDLRTRAGGLRAKVLSVVIELRGPHLMRWAQSKLLVVRGRESLGLPQ